MGALFCSFLSLFDCDSRRRQRCLSMASCIVSTHWSLQPHADLCNHILTTRLAVPHSLQSVAYFIGGQVGGPYTFLTNNVALYNGSCPIGVCVCVCVCLCVAFCVVVSVCGPFVS